MVSVDHRSSSTTTSPRSSAAVQGIYVSHRTLIVAAASLTVLLLLQARSLTSETTARKAALTTASFVPTYHQHVNSVNNLRSSHTKVSEENGQQCRFYLAESAIPHGGLGIFTGIGLHKGDTIAFPDICIYVPDMKAPERKWAHMRSHTWGWGNYFGQYEGRRSRAACEGVATQLNTVPDHMLNTKIVSPALPTNAGLDRADSPGAGSITHHYGIHGEAVDVVTAGSELTIDYGDWDFDPDKKYPKPQRSVEWLDEHGWCIDNMDIRQAIDPQMGRGAFATRPLRAGQVVAPAPLQSFANRSVFQDSFPEQLYVNYCLQPKNSNMLFFPYGQGVNLINHNSKNPNVYLRWSSNPAHQADWLDLSLKEYWKVTRPGGLILEVVALRDIQRDEELFMDYGADWEAAWNKHVAAWKPPEDAEKYIYPAEMDETEPLRTVEEQKTDPYPENLATMCWTPTWGRRERRITWYESEEYPWWQGMVYCHILDREMGETGDEVYTVSVTFHYSPHKIGYNESVPVEELYIDEQVPRRAIRFIEKPYMDDEHLPNAFRHPIELPEELVPAVWKNA